MPSAFPSTSTTLRCDQLGEIAWEAIGSPSATQLNNHVSQPLAIEAPSVYDAFNENEFLSPYLPCMEAHNGVDLYRISYQTLVPETQTEAMASGLLAIPQLPDRAELPMVSWQHGTIFEAEDAPSCIYENGAINLSPLGIPRSIETLLNVVTLAGNGYIVAAADYVGNGYAAGGNKEAPVPQAYGCKEATIQAIIDMLLASRCLIQDLGRRSKQLFLHGWSQGGLNTQWLAQALQDRHARGATEIPVPTRVAAVSAPSNLARLCGYWMNSFGGDPNWLTPATPILFGAYQHYYGMSDLLARAIRPEYLELANSIFEKTLDWNAVDFSQPTPVCRLYANVGSRVCLPQRPFDMLNPDFLAEYNQGEGEFFRQVHANTALQGRFSMPCRFYGGGSDAVVPQWSSITLPEEHQRLAGSTVSTGVAVDAGMPVLRGRAGTPGATHRSTFLASLFHPGLNVRSWFDEAL